MSVKIYSKLMLNDLELTVNLGWRTKERKHEQGILLNLMIQFPAPPKACQTDKLEDTVCYHQLIEKIRKEFANKHYRLIEHLSADIYTLIKNTMPKKTKLAVRITKYPQIEGLTGGASFCYGDPL